MHFDLFSTEHFYIINKKGTDILNDTNGFSQFDSVEYSFDYVELKFDSVELKFHAKEQRPQSPLNPPRGGKRPLG